MDPREQAFRNKFADAAKNLGGKPDQVVSLKIREIVGCYREYQELLHVLAHEGALRSSHVRGDFQGRGHLLENSKTKILIVEHETGLEILYIAGSIASLLGLIPLVLRCWATVCKHHHRSHPPKFLRIENRRIDKNGRLVEDHDNALGVPWAAPLSVMNTAIMSAAESIDSDLLALRKSAEALGVRIKKLERVATDNPKKKVAAKTLHRSVRKKK